MRPYKKTSKSHFPTKDSIYSYCLLSKGGSDIANGNMERATERVNTGDGGLAKHAAVCEHSGEGAKIDSRERNSIKRKYLEGIVSLKEKSKGIIPLNS